MGGGAELEGEGVPLIIKNDTVFVRKAVIDLLVNFRENDHDGRYQHHPADVGIRLLFGEAEQGDQSQKSQGQPYKMEQTERKGRFHGAVEKRQNRLPKRHKLKPRLCILKFLSNYTTKFPFFILRFS